MYGDFHVKIELAHCPLGAQKSMQIDTLQISAGFDSFWQTLFLQVSLKEKLGYGRAKNYAIGSLTAGLKAGVCGFSASSKTQGKSRSDC